MIAYNVYLEMDESLDEKEWSAYMIQQHIPDVMKTGCFLECRMMKVTGTERKWHIQYLLQNQENMDQYQSQYAAALKQEVVDRYPDKFKAHRTITEIIQSF